MHKSMQRYVLLFFSIFLFIFSAGNLLAAQKEWTFAVYLDADCNLEDAGISDFLEMAKVGSTDKINIVVQMDRASGYDKSYGDWKTCKRFYVTKNMKPTKDNQIEDIGEANMGKPQTLSDFVSWASVKYPAKKYAFVLWNHGGGWRERSAGRTPMARAICWDEGNSDDCLYMKEVRQAFEDGGLGCDLIGFDACLMGHFEVAYELENVLATASNSALVFSQEVEPGDGWPYDTILSWLKTNPTATGEDLGKKIAEKYGSFYGSKSDTTQSCIKSAELKNLADKLNDFADSIDDNSQLKAIQTARESCKAYSESDGYYGIDIYRFADQVDKNVTNSAIKSKASALKTAVNSAVKHTFRGSQRNDSAKYGSCGLSIYFPKTKTLYDSAYGKEILFGSAAANKWDDFLQRYYSKNLGTGGSSGGSSSSGGYGTGTAALSRKNVAPNKSYSSITYTFTPTEGSLGDGKAEITIPSGWTAPQTSSSKKNGYVKSYVYRTKTKSVPLNVSVSGQKITITGIPSDRLSASSKDKLKLSYTKFVTPSKEGTATFSTKVAGSDQALATLKKQPSVLVSSSKSAMRGDIDEEIETEDGETKKATLNQNYPNPFNPSATFSYFIPEGGRVSLKLYNVAGQEVDTIVEEDQSAGDHTVQYDSGDKLSRGIYYYRLTLNGREVGTKRAVVLK
ncbi:MAG: Clostripain precursor [Elusimicrobia bacterium ADurb.Bin231]|nr:MAG: Clostripain precursor [Elusimicrobia bacterium ADurb.Bin231]